MATTSTPLPSREATRAFVVQIASGGQGAKLRSQVTRWHPGATGDQVEDAFQEACALADRSCRGQTEGEVFTWLRTTTHRELGHIRKRAWRRSRQEILVDLSALEVQPAAGTALAPEDELIDREDQVEVERVTRAVLARLSERQRAVAALHSHGRRRPEIAEHLGMTPRSVKRALERIMAVGREDDGRAVGFVRAALVHHGVLEPRDEHSAAFARWQQRALQAIAPGPDRGHVRAYATWHVAHELARASTRGRATPATQKHARSLVSEAIKLVLWLHEQQLELRDLRQDLVDAWIAAGASTRRCVRIFLQWLARAGVTGELHVAWNTRGHSPAPLDDEQRFAALRRLLHDRDIDSRDRFAGLMLLLYAQPLTRTTTLRTTDIATAPDGQTTIRLARGAVPLPEPLGSLAHALRYQRLAATGSEGWLLAGAKAGTHISADRLRERLKRHGIASRPGRHAALLALAARLPAPILAERLGFHQARAAQWVRAAGATYADYVALRHS